MDLIGRMRNLKQKRNVIDEAIRSEDLRKMKAQAKAAQQTQKEIAKQKQLQK